MMRLGINVSFRGKSRKCGSKLVVVRPSTTWAVSEFPWSTPPRPKAKKITKEMIRVQLKKEEFEDLITEHVRNYLPRQFPMAFAARSNQHLLSPNTKTVGSVMETLATLNGYKQVPLPSLHEFVSLAEGITVEPDYYKNGSLTRSIFLYAQPIDGYAYPDVSGKKFPVLIEEDFRLYRILENMTEEFITSTYDSVRLFFLNTIVNPLDAFASRLITKKEPKVVKTEEIAPFVPKSDQPQNLIVLEGENAVMVTHMSESVQILALPYKMGHKSASTLISVSLVVFGAAPLAYRSLHFALNYPFLSKLMAASVFGTIMYGIWSGRSISRTRQSEVVSKGMGSRIYARDDAVLWALQEGAVQRVSKILLAMYYDQLDDSIDRISVKQQKPFISLLDPLELLTEMGLLVPANGGPDDKRVATNLDEAISILRSKARE